MSHVIRIGTEIHDRLEAMIEGDEKTIADVIHRVLNAYDAPYLAKIKDAYNDAWNNIAQDLSAPGATMHVDEVFEITSDFVGNTDIEPYILVWWRDQSAEYRYGHVSEIFEYEYYEVGDNSGFGPEGTMYP